MVIERKIIKNRTAQPVAATTAWERLLGRWTYYFLVFCFVVVNFYLWLFSPLVQIKQIEITGLQDLQVKQIEDKLQGYLAGRYLGIVPRSNLLFLSLDKTARRLKEDLRKLKTVTIAKKFPETLRLKVEERLAVLTYCQAESCFLLDEEGVAYAPVDPNVLAAEEREMLVLRQENAEEVVLGDQVLPAALVVWLGELKDDTNKLTGLELERELFLPNKLAEEVRGKIVDGPSLLFSLNYMPAKALKALNLLLEKEVGRSRLGELEYVDLRAEGKLFYRFKGEQPQQSQDNSGE